LYRQNHNINEVVLILIWVRTGTRGLPPQAVRWPARPNSATRGGTWTCRMSIGQLGPAPVQHEEEKRYTLARGIELATFQPILPASSSSALEQNSSSPFLSHPLPPPLSFPLLLVTVAVRPSDVKFGRSPSFLLHRRRRPEREGKESVSACFPCLWFALFKFLFQWRLGSAVCERRLAVSFSS
jgi:hypothetical protein